MDSAWVSWGEFTCWPPLGVEEKKQRRTARNELIFRVYKMCNLLRILNTCSKQIFLLIAGLKDALLLCLVLIEKIYWVFWREKHIALRNWFSPIISQVYFCFNTRFCSNSQQVFSLGNPPYAKFVKRDSLYFDLFPGPFKSANFRSIIVRY